MKKFITEIGGRIRSVFSGKSEEVEQPTSQKPPPIKPAAPEGEIPAGVPTRAQPEVTKPTAPVAGAPTTPSAPPPPPAPTESAVKESQPARTITPQKPPESKVPGPKTIEAEPEWFRNAVKAGLIFVGFNPKDDSISDLKQAQQRQHESLQNMVNDGTLRASSPTNSGFNAVVDSKLTLSFDYNKENIQLKDTSQKYGQEAFDAFANVIKVMGIKEIDLGFLKNESLQYRAFKAATNEGITITGLSKKTQEKFRDQYEKEQAKGLEPTPPHS